MRIIRAIRIQEVHPTTLCRVNYVTLLDTLRLRVLYAYRFDFTLFYSNSPGLARRARLKAQSSSLLKSFYTAHWRPDCSTHACCLNRLRNHLPYQLLIFNFSIITVNDRVVVSRSCAWEDVNAAPNSCINAQTPSYIRTEFCETCTTDGCNGASQYGPAVAMVLLMALVAKLLAW